MKGFVDPRPLGYDTDYDYVLVQAEGKDTDSYRWWANHPGTVIDTKIMPNSLCLHVTLCIDLTPAEVEQAMTTGEIK